MPPQPQPTPPRREPGPRRASGRFLAVVVAIVVAGCSTLPHDADKTPSTAFPDTDGTRIARSVAATRPAAVDPTISGVEIVSRGDEAFGDLYTLIARAERSLDLQYYIIKDDPDARSLLRAARAAAERGVRVRILLDDFYTSGKDDRIAWYAAHPNIEVRLFNPFAHGRAWFATRLVTSVLDLGRIDRRMHNKLFVVDNALAMTGGRNIGAEYYTHSGEANFLDVDVLVGGPIVHDLSDAFDRYWNSGFAVPIEALTAVDGKSLETIDQRALTDPADPVVAATAQAEASGATLAAQLDRGTLPLKWVPTALFDDQPSKIHRTAPRVGNSGLVAGATIASDVLSIIDEARTDLVIVTPYFVPGERGVRELQKLVDRGVHVRILTNSLAATDAAIVHVGYSRYRARLVAMGVEIYELRPDPDTERSKLTAIGSSKASLHAKVLLVDGRTMFIGSFNVDQRSALVNTEMGLRIDSAALCDQVLGVLRDRGPESRYRVTQDDHGHLVWTTEENGVAARVPRRARGRHAAEVVAEAARAVRAGTDAVSRMKPARV